jgi:AcrR family transcriptional regulator
MHRQIQRSDVTDTRERIVEASAELMRRQGYSATGIKQIVAQAKAPFGSIYHFFPGGKEAIGVEAIARSGALYETGVRMFFAGAAAHLGESGYEDACPIATIALEISSVSEPLRLACASVFERWISAGVERFSSLALGEREALSLVIGMLAALEGAFVLCRATRTTDALHIAGDLIAASVERSLAAPQR